VQAGRPLHNEMQAGRLRYSSDPFCHSERGSEATESKNLGGVFRTDSHPPRSFGSLRSLRMTVNIALLGPGGWVIFVLRSLFFDPHGAGGGYSIQHPGGRGILHLASCILYLVGRGMG